MKLKPLALIAGCLLATHYSFAVDAPSESVEMSAPSGLSAVNFSSTDHLIFSNQKDPDNITAPATSLFMHENTMRGDYQDYSLGINFSNRYTPDGPKNLVAPFNLEKKTLSAEFENLRIDVGDSHQEFGRGIALSLYRDPVFGVDNTLLGGSIRYHPNGLDVTAFSGKIDSLTAPVAINPIANPLIGRDMLMSGASVKGRVAEDVQLSGHYVFTQQRPSDFTQYDNKIWHTVGSTFAIDNLPGGVDVYMESNLLVTNDLDIPNANIPNGYGSYGSITWSPLPWKVKLEGKDYRSYFYDFRRPPTLEEDIVLALNTQDVSAGKLYAEHVFESSKISVYTSYLYGDDRIDRARINHAVVGAKFRGWGRNEYETKYGYRFEQGKMYMGHGALKGKFHTGKGQSLELEVRKQYTVSDLDTPSPAFEDRNQLFVTYTFSEQFNAGLGYEYIPTLPDAVGKHYPNASVTYKTGGLTARAFAGSMSAGVLCSGGVCRQVPEYSGAMLETTYVF